MQGAAAALGAALLVALALSAMMTLTLHAQDHRRPSAPASARAAARPAAAAAPQRVDGGSVGSLPVLRGSAASGEPPPREPPTTATPPRLGGACGSEAPVTDVSVSWAGDYCLSAPAPAGPVFLAAEVHARIYEADLAQLSRRDLAHWLTYYRFAGVERVYLYDTWLQDGERYAEDEHIKAGVESGFIVYRDWHKVASQNIGADGKPKRKHIFAVQEPAANDAQAKARGSARWMTLTDIDEYPFVPRDQRQGFLSRYLLEMEEREGAERVPACDRTTQVLLPNFVVQGGRDSRLGPMLIQQVSRVRTGTVNNLVKQIVRVDAADKHHVHHSSVHFGRTKTSSAADAKMMHFWGGRGLRWRRIDELSGAEREALFAGTAPADMGSIPSAILRCFPD